MTVSQPRSIRSIWHGEVHYSLFVYQVNEMTGQVKITTDLTGYAPAGKL